MPPSAGNKQAAVGELAFEAELDRLIGLMVTEDHTVAGRDLSEVIQRVGNAADGRDFLQAIRLLGDVEVTFDARPAGTRHAATAPEEVEQALGDLRRALERAPPGDGREDARKLCWEARLAAGERRWDAAWALVDEADARLAEDALHRTSAPP